MVRFFTALVFVIATIVAVVLIIGRQTPIEWTGEVVVIFDEKIDIVYDVVIDVEGIPYRKKDVKYVEILKEESGLITWKEHLSRDRFRSYRMIKKRTPSLLVVEMYESSNGLTGTWTYNLSQTGSVTKLIITEKSFNNNIWTRGFNKIQGQAVYLKTEINVIKRGIFLHLLDS